MCAQIIRIPVVHKRGRKVTTGPSCSVTVIYEATEESSPAHELMAGVLDRVVARQIEQRAQYEVWIDLSRTVVRWPEGRRFRTTQSVERLKAGMAEEVEVDAELARRRLDIEKAICNRREEIHKGRAILRTRATEE